MNMTPQKHDVHMQKMLAGLQQIMQTEDINEAKQIAQSLLQEEEGEAQTEETPTQKPSMRERYAAMVKDKESAQGGMNE